MQRFNLLCAMFLVLVSSGNLLAETQKLLPLGQNFEVATGNILVIGQKVELPSSIETAEPRHEWHLVVSETASVVGRLQVHNQNGKQVWIAGNVFDSEKEPNAKTVPAGNYMLQLSGPATGTKSKPFTLTQGPTTVNPAGTFEVWSGPPEPNNIGFAGDTGVPLISFTVAARGNDISSSVTIETKNANCFSLVGLTDEHGTVLNRGAFGPYGRVALALPLVKNGDRKSFTVTASMAENFTANAGQVVSVEIPGFDTQATVTGNLPIKGMQLTLNPNRNPMKNGKLLAPKEGETVLAGTVSTLQSPHTPGQECKSANWTLHSAVNDMLVGNLEIKGGTESPTWIVGRCWNEHSRNGMFAGAGGYFIRHTCKENDRIWNSAIFTIAAAPMASPCTSVIPEKGVDEKDGLNWMILRQQEYMQELERRLVAFDSSRSEWDGVRVNEQLVNVQNFDRVLARDLMNPGGTDRYPSQETIYNWYKLQVWKGQLERRCLELLKYPSEGKG